MATLKEKLYICETPSQFQIINNHNHHNNNNIVVHYSSLYSVYRVLNI